MTFCRITAPTWCRTWDCWKFRPTGSSVSNPPGGSRPFPPASGPCWSPSRNLPTSGRISAWPTWEMWASETPFPALSIWAISTSRRATSGYRCCGISGPPGFPPWSAGSCPPETTPPASRPTMSSWSSSRPAAFMPCNSGGPMTMQSSWPPWASSPGSGGPRRSAGPLAPTIPISWRPSASWGTFQPTFCRRKRCFCGCSSILIGTWAGSPFRRSARP